MRNTCRVLVVGTCLTLGAMAARAVSQASGQPQVGRVTVLRTPDGGIQPQVALDANGGIQLIYFKGEPAHGDLFYVRIGADGAFSRPVQVNSTPGSAIATGAMRGGHLAIGRNGRVHVAWHGSDKAMPRADGNATPVLYSRMNAAGNAFEPPRNVVRQRLEGLDGGTVAADASGNVYVAWHAFQPGMRGEEDRRVWIARSTDDGRTFARESAASAAATGTCGCCAVGAFADRRGTLYLLYRSATELVHRDKYLLTSRDKGLTFASDMIQEWNVGACPMSTSSLSESESGVLAAWETGGQVQWLRIDPNTGARSQIIAAPGSSKSRKHPVVTSNGRGETILVWTEGTGWNKGGGLAWQVFDNAGKTIGAEGRAEGVPAWSMAAVAARQDGSFMIVY